MLNIGSIAFPAIIQMPTASSSHDANKSQRVQFQEARGKERVFNLLKQNNAQAVAKLGLFPHPNSKRSYRIADIGGGEGLFITKYLRPFLPNKLVVNLCEPSKLSEEYLAAIAQDPSITKGEISREYFESPRYLLPEGNDIVLFSHSLYYNAYQTPQSLGWSNHSGDWRTHLFTKVFNSLQEDGAMVVILKYNCSTGIAKYGDPNQSIVNLHELEEKEIYPLLTEMAREKNQPLPPNNYTVTAALFDEAIEAYNQKSGQALTIHRSPAVITAIDLGPVNFEESEEVQEILNLYTRNQYAKMNLEQKEHFLSFIRENCRRQEDGHYLITHVDRVFAVKKRHTAKLGKLESIVPTEFQSSYYHHLTKEIGTTIDRYIRRSRQNNLSLLKEDKVLLNKITATVEDLHANRTTIMSIQTRLKAYCQAIESSTKYSELLQLKTSLQQLILFLEKPERAASYSSMERLREEQQFWQTSLNAENLKHKLIESKRFAKERGYFHGLNPHGVFICYAWIEPKNRKMEAWIQSFLSDLAIHLQKAGIPVMLDILNPGTQNIREYMRNKIASARVVIIMGTSSLKEKERIGRSNVAYELNYATFSSNDYRKYGFNELRIIPVTLQGPGSETMLPAIHEGFGNIEDARSKNYLSLLETLIAKIYDLGGSDSSDFLEYQNIWCNHSPFFKQEITHYDAIDDNSFNILLYLLGYYQSTMCKKKFLITQSSIKQLLERTNSIREKISEIIKKMTSENPEKNERFNYLLNISGKNTSLLHLAVLTGQAKKDLQKLLGLLPLDPNTWDGQGYSPLHVAARIGDLDIVKLLCNDPRIKKDIASANGSTPLYEAAAMGHKSIVEYLHQQGAKLDTVTKEGTWTPLSVAARFGRQEVVTYLLEKKDSIVLSLAQTNKWKENPLICACAHNHIEVVKKLVSSFQEKILDQDCEGYTAMHHAIRQHNIEMLALLLKSILVPDVDKEKRSLKELLNSLSIEEKKRLKDLMKLTCRRGNTLLHLAAQEEDLDMVEMLSDICIKSELTANEIEHNNAGLMLEELSKNPKIKACFLRISKTARKIEDLSNVASDRKEQLEQLPRNPIEYHDRYHELHTLEQKTGGTLLTLAASLGHSEQVQTLLDYDFDINAKDDEGRTALIIAVENGYRETVKVLIERRASINQQDNEGNSALHIAVRRRALEMVRLLTASHAVDYTLKEKKLGETVLHLAASSNDIELVNLILQQCDERCLFVTSRYNRTALDYASDSVIKEVIRSQMLDSINLKLIPSFTAEPIMPMKPKM